MFLSRSDQSISLGLWFLYLVPGISVSVSRGVLTRAGSLPVGLAGLLAPGLLLGPALHVLVSGMMRMDSALGVPGIASALVVPENRTEAVRIGHRQQLLGCCCNLLTPLTCPVCPGKSGACAAGLRSPALRPLRPRSRASPCEAERGGCLAAGSWSESRTWCRTHPAARLMSRLRPAWCLLRSSGGLRGE